MLRGVRGPGRPRGRRRRGGGQPLAAVPLPQQLRGRRHPDRLFRQQAVALPPEGHLPPTSQQCAPNPVWVSPLFTSRPRLFAFSYIPNSPLAPTCCLKLHGGSPAPLTGLGNPEHQALLLRSCAGGASTACEAHEGFCRQLCFVPGLLWLRLHERRTYCGTSSSASSPTLRHRECSQGIPFCPSQTTMPCAPPLPRRGHRQLPAAADCTSHQHSTPPDFTRSP